MLEAESETSITFDQLGQQQLVIYAKEFHELVLEERRLRQELEDRNRVLEQRVREVEGLNRMFQCHLKERYEMEESYQRLSYKLISAAQQFRSIMNDAREQKTGAQLIGVGRVLQGLCTQITNLAMESQVIMKETEEQKAQAITSTAGR